ncbi:hypothetical protein N1851_021730 [Merluccius polli]|uniref:Uncharacterized protein n=1 Tax=Merluccius polli TaxID=89951 RepID=A0AA47MJN8_MERPO|nr:hypothetical protein N1851_021730 [Merluccius polli]
MFYKAADEHMFHSRIVPHGFLPFLISDVNGNTVAPFPQRTATSTSGDWKTDADPKRAVWLFTQELLNNKNGSEENHFSVDLRKDQEEQDRSYVSIYKRRNVEWASPLTCTLEGDAAVGLGVNRHVMSTMMLKMRTGFQLKLGQCLHRTQFLTFKMSKHCRYCLGYFQAKMLS